MPIYQQIRDRIVEAIATGEATVGSGLPSTRQLRTMLAEAAAQGLPAEDVIRCCRDILARFAPDGDGS